MLGQVVNKVSMEDLRISARFCAEFLAQVSWQFNLVNRFEEAPSLSDTEDRRHMQ
jgi:hypothetical protein